MCEIIQINLHTQRVKSFRGNCKLEVMKEMPNEAFSSISYNDEGYAQQENEEGGREGGMLPGCQMFTDELPIRRLLDNMQN